MSTYGITRYGTDVYGLSLPPAYILPYFTAQPVNYSTIRLSWGTPSGTISRYRLLANRYGYPVSETDGTILFDQTTFPGNAWNDQAVIPGTYHHYGFYVLVDVADNIWIRAGVTGCLGVASLGSAQWLQNRLPDHFKYLYSGGELTGDASGNSYLQQFLNVLGWGFDRVQTQYGMLAQHLNDPMSIPVNDLLALAAQVGLSPAPGTPAYTIRKGTLNQAHVSRERGTPLGLAGEVTIRTGWGADVHAGPNLLLDTDQSTFLDPVFEPYTAGKFYQVGECVWVGPSSSSRVWSGAGWWYQCIQAVQNVAPPGDGTSTAYWQALNNSADFQQTLTDPRTGNPSTWEALSPSAGFVPPGTLGQSLGVANVTGAGFAWNSAVVTNTTATAQTYLLRSVSRGTADLGAIPDPGFEAGFTIIPKIGRPNPVWVPATWPKIMTFTSVGYPGQYRENGKYLASAFWTSPNDTIDRQNGGAHSGAWCAAVIPPVINVPGLVQVSSPWAAVQPGANITVSLWLNAKASSAIGHLAIIWLDSHGSEISPAAISNGTSLPPGTWTKAITTGTAPAKAAFYYLTLVVNMTILAAVKMDDISVSTPAGNPPGFAPDPADVIASAIPVPWVRDSQQWNPATRYGTGDIVLHQGQPFQALRASTGAVPPQNNVATPEWAPLSENRRIRVCESGYLSQNLTVTTAEQAPVTPFVEWYDQHGNYITRIVARTPGGNGTTGKPNNLVFDSFTGPSRLTNAAGNGSVTLPPWQATFWANPSLSGPSAFTRTDQAVNFTWTGQQPAQSVGISGWSASWVTYFTPAVSGTYTFTLTSPGGGSRMFVNATTVINNWTAKSVSPQSGSIALQAGRQVAIQVEYTVPAAPLVPTKGWTANLLPATWTPGTLPASWTSPLFPVIAGLPYMFTVATLTGQITAQVTWYDGATRIGQAQASGTGTVSVGNGTQTVPSGANWASVYVKVSGSKTGFTMSFRQQLTTAAPAGLKLTEPVPFTASAGPQYSTLLTGRTTDDNQSTWLSGVGSLQVGQGEAYPVTIGQRSYSLIAGQPNTQVAVTLRSSPGGGLAQGLILRWTDDTHYWRCDRTGLRSRNGANWTTVAAHSTPFSDGDRMTVILNGNSITVLRNGVQVATATSSYNSSSGTHGVIVNDVAVST